MLYLVSTPIGNLGDITYRAVDVLRQVDLILCEDTRHSKTLLQKYQIENNVESYHQFSEQKKIPKIIEKLKEGKTVALISDAGTPIIQDPGSDLLTACKNAAIPVTAVPGACAFITAVTLTGTPPPFQFIGFLPKKAEGTLKEIALYQGTTLCYESPNRLLKTLTALQKLLPKRTVTVARELTKKYEEVFSGLPKTLIEQYTDKPPKGEIVLVIHPGDDATAWDALTPKEHVDILMSEYQISKQEAIKIAAKLRGVPKSGIYRENL